MIIRRSVVALVVGVVIGSVLGTLVGYLAFRSLPQYAGKTPIRPNGRKKASQEELRQFFRALVIPEYELAYSRVKDVLRGIHGEVVIEVASEKGIPRYDELIRALKNDIGEIDSARPVLLLHGLLELGSSSRSVQAIGVDLASQERLLRQNISIAFVGPRQPFKHGTDTRTTANGPLSNAILSADMLGDGPARVIGNSVNLRILKVTRPFGAFVHKTFRVKGIFDRGAYLGQNIIFVGFSIAQDMLAAHGRCHEIWIHLKGQELSERDMNGLVERIRKVVATFAEKGQKPEPERMKVRTYLDKYAKTIESFRAQMKLVKELYKGSG